MNSVLLGNFNVLNDIEFNYKTFLKFLTTITTILQMFDIEFTCAGFWFVTTAIALKSSMVVRFVRWVMNCCRMASRLISYWNAFKFACVNLKSQDIKKHKVVISQTFRPTIYAEKTILTF